MHRVSTIDSLFHDGNPATGVQGTPVDAAWFNASQEELAAVIEGTGLILSGADNTQLRQAITKMIQSGQRTVIINNATFAPAVAGTGKAVYWDSANNRFDLALADGSSKQNMVGFADVVNGNVYAFGDVLLFTGLTAGRYYLDGTTAGAITASVPATNAVYIGIAKSATEVFVDIDASTSSPPVSIQGAFRNLKGSAPGTSEVVTYTIDELVTGDGAGNFQTTRAWNNTITMTSAGAGGLDTGVVAGNTWYYAYGITKPDASKALIASLSAIGPALPSGYTKWARIGAFRTDGTANKYPLSFKQYARKVQYVVAAGSNVAVGIAMASGVAGSVSTPTFVAVSTSNFVPATAARISGIIANTGLNNSGFIVAPNNSYGPMGSATNPAPWSSNPNSNTYGGVLSNLFEFSLESSNIYWASAIASTTMYIYGWEDNL